MEILYTQEQIDQTKSREKIPLKCHYCGETFWKMKKYILDFIKNPNAPRNIRKKHMWCSEKCVRKDTGRDFNIDLACTNCGKIINKELALYRKSKSNNHFCSQSCAATYNNKNKKYGIRRSKLEIWLEIQLKQLYPNLLFDFNSKTAIGSELDIYIPSLKLAFELNGIFHYEPIFGDKTLQKVNNNDKRKVIACYEKQIELCVIDSSKFGYFKEEGARVFLDIITKIINERLSIPVEVEVKYPLFDF